MNRVIFNQKGGVGKTSVTCNLAASFARLGKKVLVVDLDAQANASHYLLAGANWEPNIADFFSATLGFTLFQDSLAGALHHSRFEQLYVVPAASALAELQPKLEARYKIFKLQAAVAEVKKKFGFDEVLFDTPPALNFYSLSALMAADRVLIPFDCDEFSAQGLQQVIGAIREVIADHRPLLMIEGVVVNGFQSGAKLPRDTVAKLKPLGVPVLEPFVSTSVVMKESHAARTPLAFLKPKHKLTEEFRQLAQHLLRTEKAAPALKGNKSREISP
jgi:chromosome partitioning protein